MSVTDTSAHCVECGGVVECEVLASDGYEATVECVAGHVFPLTIRDPEDEVERRREADLADAEWRCP